MHIQVVKVQIPSMKNLFSMERYSHGLFHNIKGGQPMQGEMQYIVGLLLCRSACLLPRVVYLATECSHEDVHSLVHVHTVIFTIWSRLSL